MALSFALGSRGSLCNHKFVNSLHWFIGFTGCAALMLFSAIFHRTRADLLAARSFGVPVAVARETRARVAAHRGRLRLRLASGLATGMPTVQAIIVAVAATSVLVMSLCLMACVVLAVVGR